MFEKPNHADARLADYTPEGTTMKYVTLCLALVLFIGGCGSSKEVQKESKPVVQDMNIQRATPASDEK